MIDEDTWQMYAQFAPTDLVSTSFRAYSRHNAGVKKKDAIASTMSLNKDYIIAASNPELQWSSPRFRKEQFHPSFDARKSDISKITTRPLFKFEDASAVAIRELTKEYLEDLKTRVPVNTGLLRDSIIYGKGTFTLPGDVSYSGHNHGKKEKVITKWQPNKYSADKRKRYRLEAAWEVMVLGKGYAEVAHKYGVRRQTIHNWVSLAKQGRL